MTHTSGVGGEQRTERSLQDTVAAIIKRPLLFEPGTKWQYSPGLSVCGRVVEVVSKRSFDEFLDERIFQPLGMKDTTFRPTDSQRQRLARSYSAVRG
jgi:CubicO group peptidase (beta-lactamase class C family)